ncbi:MAG: hypothetical protein LQ348_005384 [Seirophora lacunosa]|nr:MAG: hypothetical protein LQ348_005384 [Seirophora lacunosa]
MYVIHKNGSYHLDLTRVPQYSHEINLDTQDRAHWVAVSSSSTSYAQAASEIKSHFGSPVAAPTPFLGCIIRQVYAFFKDHLLFSPSTQNAFNHLRLGHGFPKGGHTVGSLGTKFFSAPTPQTSTKAMLSPRLKTIRLPLVAAFENVELLEDLIITASELHRRIFEDPDVMTLRLIPPAPLIPIPPFTNDEDQEYKIGTPAESRKRKRQGLRLGEQSLRGAGSF